MDSTPTVKISFRELEPDERVRETIEKRCLRLAQEFPEALRFEVSLAPDGAGLLAHARVSGRDTEVATHAEGREAVEAADRVLDRVERQLRRVHDKRIFARRREAQKASPKRQP